MVAKATIIPAQTAPKYNLCATDGSIPLTGIAFYFLRVVTKAITTTNVYTDVSFGSISQNILPSLTQAIKNVIVPALKAQVCF